MELKQVHKHVDAYVDGTATLEQEQVLFLYFTQADVDASLAHYVPYFTAIAQERNETFSGVAVPVKPSKNYWRNAVAVAAIAVVSVIATQQNNSQPQQLTAEELVFEEFKANMYLVSEKLNKGKEGMAYMETFNETATKFIKTK